MNQTIPKKSEQKQQQRFLSYETNNPV